jgi:ubiquitin carboxyl-terminal hydrolase L5
MADNWCTIESDPGVFTELIEEIGVKDCQVEELYVLDQGDLQRLKPVHGLIFLFKWRADESDNRATENPFDTDVFFANQVINNACATQAILSILLNASKVDLGEELTQFKEFSQEFPPDMRGLAISNSDLIRRVHNSFSRPEPFIYSGGKQDESSEDVYHFISYLPYKGRLYELDGLKKGPINLGPCTEEDWLEKVCPEIQKRIEKYARSEIRFNLMAIIKNRVTVYKEQIQDFENQKADVNTRLMDLQEGPEADNLKQQLALLNDQISTCQEAIKLEEDKRKNWRLENIRRKHNYIPFIMNMLKILAEKGQLVDLVERAKSKEAEEKERRKDKQ